MKDLEICRFLEYGSVHAKFAANSVEIPLDDFKNFDVELERLANLIHKLIKQTFTNDLKLRKLKLSLTRKIGGAEEGQGSSSQIKLLSNSFGTFSQAGIATLKTKASNLIKYLTLQILTKDRDLFNGDKMAFELNTAEINLTESVAEDFLKAKGGKEIKKPFGIAIGDEIIDISGRFTGEITMKPTPPSDGHVHGRINQINIDERMIEIKENRESKSIGIKLKYKPNTHFLKILTALESQQDHDIAYLIKHNGSGGHSIKELVSIEIREEFLR